MVGTRKACGRTGRLTKIAPGFANGLRAEIPEGNRIRFLLLATIRIRFVFFNFLLATPLV